MPWNLLTVKRSELRRVGSTFGKNLSTVRGLRMMVKASEGGPQGEVRFEDTRISGGVNRPIFGEVQYRYVYVRNDGTYLSKSAPSAASSKFTLNGNGATVRIPADGSRDSQINEIWLFRIGGGLPDWYRVVVKTGVSGTGSVDIDDEVSNLTALAANIKLEDDNAPPPDSIIGIDGPYYDRTFYLTATHLYPSRRRNPDSCSARQAITVAGADEQALWVKKTAGGLFIGTTKDIYWLSGDGAEYPDLTVNFTLKPLNIDNPPRSEAVAQEGNRLVYFAADGWRTLQGTGSELLTGITSLLYHGYARHEVSAINVEGGRFRGAITRGMLSAITPEGIASSSSTILYRHEFGTPRWFRHTYTPSWRSVYREPDGTLIAGSSAGQVWVLDSGVTDNGTRIPVVMWTLNDHVGHPFQRKDPHDFRTLIDTGGRDAQITLHTDNADTVAAVLIANNNGLGDEIFSLTQMPSFRLVQYRITGDFSQFRWASSNLGFHPLPMVMRGHTPPYNFGKPGIKTISSIQLRICTLGQTRVINPVLDGTPYAPFNVTSATDEPTNRTYTFPFAVRAAEIMLLINGDVELYDWYPLVTHVQPLGVRDFDTGPLDLGTGEFIWPREVWMKVVASANLRIQPYFDGVGYGTVDVVIGPNERNTASKIRVSIPRGYKGRVPRFRIYSTEPFYPYWFEFVSRETRAGLEKTPIRVPSGFGEEVKS